jgi:hypothetical protein
MSRAHNFNDLSGRRFGRLIALDPVKIGPKKIKWRCRCDCGGTALVIGPKLKTGNTSSCGCFQEESRKRKRTHDLTVRGELPPEYESWCKIKARCHNPKSDRYRFYGGRGITMCERWRNSFPEFLADLGPRPGPGYTVERLDNNGHYEPSNCCWATKKTQANNRRSNKRVQWQVQDLTLAEWSDELGIPAAVLSARLRHGWSVERAFTETVRVRNKHRSGNLPAA